MMRARKRDTNERDIIDALRAAGASVTQLNEAGVPDLLVGWRGKTAMYEVKEPSRKDGKAHKRAMGELTEAQAQWWSGWRGERAVIVHSVEEALDALGKVHGSGDGCFAPTDREAYPPHWLGTR